MNTLIKDAFVLLGEGIVKQTDIGICDDKILYIGDIPEKWQINATIDGKDKFAMPGLVNAHTHASMTLLRSYADDMALMDWWKNHVWPVEAKMKKADIYWGAMLAAAEMIKSGTTAFADMYSDMEQVAKVVIESGMRAVLTRGSIGMAPNGQTALRENEQLFIDFHNTAEGRLSVMFGPHAPYTCPPDFLRQVVSIAQKRNGEIHTHLAETKKEVADCLAQYGMTPTELLEDTGILSCGVLAAHCVHLSEHDIELIAKYKVRVAHNPGSNMKLASGIAPVPDLLRAGICVGLGTDGASSNNNLDMLEEVNLAALLHKVNTLDPLAVPAGKALQMGTYNGAVALGFSDVGRIKPGYKADIILLNMNSEAWYPRHDLISLLVYSANSSSVDTVMVNGKVLMEHRNLLTLDEERILYEAEKRAKDLIK